MTLKESYKGGYMKKGNTSLVVDALLTGKKFHSSDWNKLVGWSWTKYVSNAKKELVSEGYVWHTEPADKKMNWYWVTKERLF